ncbi:MAG: outer membrane beta-barrel protein [Sedimentisphaerales bacterium]|jgi:opacity protein-like surface antigen|nr:outer membrane beta-barrel protein [Sedimentisphaerales bacterium]HNY80264.1 outer membrane beta-barrel protein [Sedimentisphaerales bacterium]HOH66023.1 outer membrane beta-barrel protein [Sedimentisphaerales bacterium]HQA89776.1 outer membrane beta-barrel protein [Sedimentisphaerales bacterium]HQN35535.1 outer membrane beta-barrel protein [Sedimentisphaerales bacterium]
MKMGMKVLATVGVLLATASVVVAQQREWSFEVTPYFWAAGIEGDATVQGQDVDIDVGFDDLFDAVDAGGGLMTVAQRGSFVVFGQFDYVGMDTDQLDPAPAGGSIQTDSFFGAVAVGFQFKGPLKNSTIDLLGGLRYAWMNNDLEITGGASGEDSLDILDGIVMVRPSVRLTERWRFNPTFAIGAGDSDLTWEVQPSVQYQFADHLALRVGYRRVHYDIEGDHGNAFDAAFHGVMAGLSLMF